VVTKNVIVGASGPLYLPCDCLLWCHVKDAVFVPPLLTEIPRLEGVISEEFIKDVLAKVSEEMGIWNSRCPFDAWLSQRGSFNAYRKLCRLYADLCKSHE
jgi:hypothetical protein